MRPSLDRLQRMLNPAAVVVIGGGAWCAAVIAQCRATGFTGAIWPVHPSRESIGGLPAFATLDALPGVPDAAFIGVNRVLSVEVTAALAARGCGGAVCFAAGFREALAELADGAALQEALVEAAGEMAILGPNCYGFVNALERVSLWPDLHGLVPVERGVAIIGQSSNVLINLSMQRRGLPLAAVVAVGNQAQTTMADIGAALVEDPRITALGLHIEGLCDLEAFAGLAARAAALGKPVVVLKVGRSEQAQQAAISHTASLAGSEAGARALFARLGLAQVDSPSVMLEALKIAHVSGGLASATVVSASCSGGEASIIADLGQGAGVVFPPLAPAQGAALRAALGPRVALANPLDYNTYVWDDAPALRATFGAMMQAEFGLGLVVLDLPRPDRFTAPAYEKVLDAVIAVRAATGRPMAILSLMAEGLPEPACARLIAEGVIPLNGMAEGLAAIRAMAGRPAAPGPLRLPGPARGPATRLLGEAEAKARLAGFGLTIPRAARAASPAAAAEAAQAIGFPVVLKGEGIAHKTEAGAVVLGLGTAAAVQAAAEAMPATRFLVEEMVQGTVAEILVGVLRDPAHGFVLTLGLGGIWTELVRDTVSLLVPATEAEVAAALLGLRSAALLTGFRGRPAGDLAATVAAVMAVQRLVEAEAHRLEEIEINPLIVTPARAVAADALIRMGEEE